jgi:hypothetical protein
MKRALMVALTLSLGACAPSSPPSQAYEEFLADSDERVAEALALGRAARDRAQRWVSQNDYSVPSGISGCTI